MSENERDLYIVVNNDLSPFQVDLKALTRGLAVVGQSGCGKSFLIGRLVEELIRNTTKKTRLLIIDSNSDFAQGTTLKKKRDLKALLDQYMAGLLIPEFSDFKKRELAIRDTLQSRDKLPRGQLFGREEAFNLSWQWLVEGLWRFLGIVKAHDYSVAYPWAFLCLENAIKNEYKYMPEKWVAACREILAFRAGQVQHLKFVKKESIAELTKTLEEKVFLELLTDLEREFFSDIWRETQDDKGLPERLFADSRINIMEIETISERKARLTMLAFILRDCWRQHVDSVEGWRESRNKTAKHRNSKPHQNLKHTFILIDEAQNYAPDETSDPHEKMVGELIRTIAAEGRKYGLHVILATQRPNKVKRGLLGECDNAIIMKMNSRSDLEHLAREMRILDVKLLEPCLHFQGQGNAIAVGEMTRVAPYVRLFKTAPRRTVEGGVDIPGF